MSLNEKIIEAAKLVSEILKEKNIPHALCGGLAVEFYGYPRLTRDVDIVLGDEGLESHPDGRYTLKEDIGSARGVKVDFIVRVEFEINEQSFEGMPVVSLRSLILMKLRTGRDHDIHDLAELMKLGKISKDMSIPEECAEVWNTVQRLASGANNRKGRRSDQGNFLI